MTRSATRQPDYYKLLGVAHNATPEEIRRAYRTAMKEVHPDRQTPEARLAADERAKTLNVAYTTLSQPERRRKYDTSLRASAVQEQIMSRYTGDMHISKDARDPFTGQPPTMRPRRYQTEQVRQEQQKADRSASSSLLFVFGGAALFVVLAIVMFAVVSLVISSVT
jgi:DnaJ-class molecular chaperone